MKPKTTVTIALLAFVLACIAYLVVTEVREARSPQSSSSGKPVSDQLAPVDSSERPPEGNHRVVFAYYFHTQNRCQTCRRLEAYAAEALQSGFSEALENGRLVWEVINYEKPDNEHFVGHYELHSPSLVIVDRLNGKQIRWKKLSKIWDLVSDKEAYLDHVKSEVQTYLDEAQWMVP